MLVHFKGELRLYVLINQFILNFCILFTAVSLFFLPFRHKKRISPKSPVSIRLAIGLASGAIAMMLMFNSLQIDIARVDLRLVPVVIAGMFGGFLSSFTTGAMISAARFATTPAEELEGAIISTVVLLLIIVTMGLFRKYSKPTFGNFQRMIIAGVLYSLPAIYFLTNGWIVFFKIAFIYTVANLFGGYVTYRMLTEMRRHFDHVKRQQRLALTDALTGLANRRRLDEVLVRAEESNGPYSLLLVDIDFFKRVNDEYGHDAGDDVLQQLGKVLLSSVRQEDIVGRFGGEEFLVYLPNTRIKEAILIAERCRYEVEQHTFSARGQTLQITVSLGLSESAQEFSSDDVLQQADKALYVSKKDGRNRVTPYERSFLREA